MENVDNLMYFYMDKLTNLLSIEGVGSEVLITGFIATLTLSLLFYLINRQIRTNGFQFIHPSNQEAVDSARHQLNILYSNRLLSSRISNGTNQSNANNSNGEQPNNTDNGDGNNQRTDENNLGDNFVNLNHYGVDSACPVCLNDPVHPVETNCGHLFCGKCLIVYWRHGSWLGPVLCPVCRQQVSLILQCFRIENDISTEESNEIQNLLREVHEYNRRFSGAPRPVSYNILHLLDSFHDQLIEFLFSFFLFLYFFYSGSIMSMIYRLFFATVYLSSLQSVV